MMQSNNHQHSSRPRLCEPFSPKRAYLSLRTPKPLAWARSRTQNIQVSSRPRLGECLSLEQETKSLNPVQSRLGEIRVPEPKMRLCNSRLGEMDSLGRDLQSSNSDHALNSPNLAQFTQQNIPKQHSIIAQHKTMANKHQTCYFIHSYYPNSRLSYPYPIPYENPHYTQYKHKRLCTQTSSQPIHNHST